MKKILFFLFLLVSRDCFAHQRVAGLYVDTFGDEGNRPLIFVHGGPGYSSFDFQASTADTLSKYGYYVVVYDQRGQGRNEDASPTDFTYDKYADDLKALVGTLRLHRPVLLAHSHGGMISIRFDKKYPGIAGSIVLVSAPLDLWSSIESIAINCVAVYKKQNKPGKAKEVKEIVKSLSEYAKPTWEEVVTLSSLFIHGMRGCGLYRPSKPTELLNPDSIKEFKEKSGGYFGPFADPMKSMPGFLFNENYIKVQELEYVKNQKGRFFGIYGSDDGVFRRANLSTIKSILGESRFSIIEGASHALYSQRQGDFVKELNRLLSNSL